jgi:hypothetical protein
MVFLWLYEAQQSDHAAENYDRLKADSSEHPFDNLGFGLGNIGSQVRTEGRQIGPGRQVCLHSFGYSVRSPSACSGVKWVLSRRARASFNVSNGMAAIGLTLAWRFQYGERTKPGIDVCHQCGCGVFRLDPIDPIG